MTNITEQIIKYENGNMEEEEITIFFQNLINTGMAWRLQGHYGRTAMALIQSGYCSRTMFQEERSEIDELDEI